MHNCVLCITARSSHTRATHKPMKMFNIRSVIAALATVVASGVSAQAVKSVVPGFRAPKADSEYDQKLLDDVSRVGWHHVHIQADKSGPPFAFSLGFYANYGLPEVVVFGLPAKAAHQFLNIAAIRVAGEKKPYEMYKAYDDIAEGMKIAFIPVSRRHYPTYLSYAGWFYQSVKTDFPTIQMVWPDKRGRLPWEDGYDKSFSKFQPLLDK